MNTNDTAMTAMALRKLVRAGSVRQLAFAARDAAAIAVVGVGAFFVSKPLGIGVIGLGVLLFVLFATFVVTSGARLEKAVRDSGRIRRVIVADATKRASMARLWVVATDNRTSTVPLLASDADVAVAALGRVLAAKAITRFPDETAARAEVKRLAGT